MDMNTENKVLQVESLSHIPFNDLLSLFQQGYKFAEQSENAIELGLSIGLNVKGNNVRSLATCVTTIQTGKTIMLSTTMSSGTAPYTYYWTLTKPDGSTETLANQASNQHVTTQNGDYTVSVYAKDSCVGGAKTSNIESCKITASTVVIPTKYNCVAGHCIGPSLTGTYSSLAECQTACVTERTKYNCTAAGHCFGPLLTGKYDSLEECEADCKGPSKYNCVAGHCVGPRTSGTYDSLEACETACVVIEQKWKCADPATRTCVRAPDGTFNSRAECQLSASCQPGGGGIGGGCTNCPSDKNYCLAGQCIPKKYALAAGIGLVALLVLSRK